MELIYKDKIIDYIRADIEFADMAAHIRKSLNKDSLKVFASFLNLHINIERIKDYKRNDNFTIKHELLFLVYKEAISINEAFEIMSSFINIFDRTDDDAIQSVLETFMTDLFFFVCIELNQYTNNGFAIHNIISMFDYLSKIFIGSTNHMAYKDMDDLESDLNKIEQVTQYKQCLEYFSHNFNIDLQPYLINNDPCSMLDLIGQISNGYCIFTRCSQSKISLPSIESLRSAYDSANVTYSDGLKQYILVGKDFMQKSCMKNGSGYYGKYALYTYQNLPEFISMCNTLIQLCVDIKNRLISYAIS